MTVTEKIGALGSWSVQLSDLTPDEVKRSLDYFGHVAIIRGRVNPADHGDALLTAARYVGVLRRRQGELETELSGSGMVFWLGDEDDKGQVIEDKIVLTDATLTEALQAVLPDAVQLGTVIDPGGTYSGTHQWQTPRQAVQVICDAFGVEFRVNGDATIDVGTQAQLYTTNPDSIVVRRGAGSDLDVTALRGSFDGDTSVIDYSTRVVLLGRTQDDGAIATGAAELDEVPYVDLHGNPVRFTRLISESEQTEGSVQARTQLQLNRFARTARSLKVTAERYETDGNFVVGDNAWVYDPDTGIVSPDYEVSFRGQVLHPDVIRVVGVTWPVTADHTVAFRTQAGEWVDLTRWVVWENGDNELVLGDLPRSLLGGGGNPILDRTDTPRDTIAPGVPTGLTLASHTATAADGHEGGFIDASWTAPAVNEDGSVVTDLSHYLVAWKWQPGLQWQYATVADTAATLPATPGLPYDVFVGAYDRSNNFSGWSAVETITVDADSTPPGAPADPVVTDYLMQLRIEYLGVDALGDPMPSDANRVDVETATSSAGPWTVVSSLSPFVKGVAYATAPTDAATFVRLVAYDHTGNASAPSGVVSGTTSKIVGDDVLDGAIGTAKLADLAVVTAKIGELDLNNGRVGNLNVGKLDAGELDVEVVIGSGRIVSGDPLGQRTEHNPLGFYGYDADQALTIRLDGVDNLLTGMYRTALDGRRIVIGAVGSTGEIQFFSPDGTKALLRAWTEPGGPEAIQFGIPVTTDNLWNRINYNASSDGEYATYRSGTHEFIFDTGPDQIGLDGEPNGGRFVVFETTGRGTTPVEARLVIDQGATSIMQDGHLRFYVDVDDTGVVYTTGGVALSISDAGSLNFWDGDGEHRFRIGDDLILSAADGAGTVRGRVWIDGGQTRFYQGDAATTGLLEMLPGGQFGGSSGWVTSERIRLTTAGRPSDGGVFSAMLQYGVNNDGTNYGIECRNGQDTDFVPIKATSLISSSDARGKTEVVPADLDAWPLIRDTPVRRYRRERRDGGPQRPVEIGLVAQEAPAQIVAADASGQLGVDLYQYVALLHLAVQQAVTGIENRLTNLEDAA